MAQQLHSRESATFAYCETVRGNMKNMITLYFLFSLVGISASCSPEINSKKFIEIEETKNEQDSSWRKAVVTKEQCKTFGIPEIGFSILVPNEYEIQYNHKQGSALRIYIKKDNKIETEIAFGTVAFEEKYTLEHEKKSLEEFKDFPKIKNNPDLSIEVFSGLQILNGEHNYYVMKLNNDSKKYLTNLPYNSVCITHPTPEGMGAVVIAVSNYTFNSESPLSEIETEIINSLKFE